MEIKDLAEYHQLVSGIFGQPQSKEEWDQYRLSEEQVAHFREYGYLSGIKLLNGKQIESARILSYLIQYCAISKK